MPPKLPPRCVPYKSLRKPYYVYFLTHWDAVVYVGQTCRLDHRINFHRRDKLFDGVYVLRANSAAQALRWEAQYIREYRPAYNTHQNPDGRDRAMENRVSIEDDVRRREELGERARLVQENPGMDWPPNSFEQRLAESIRIAKLLG